MIEYFVLYPLSVVFCLDRFQQGFARTSTILSRLDPPRDKIVLRDLVLQVSREISLRDFLQD